MATTVPYTGDPSVAATDTPIPSRSADAPLSAFGGASAAAESQLGGQLQKSGTELWDRAIAMQQLNEQADAINKISDLSDRQTDEYMKFRSLEGKAAVDAFPGFKDKMNSIREDVGATLNSDYARKVYLQESRAQQTRVMFSAAAHAGDQQKHYLVGTSEARISSAASAASADAESDDTFKASLQTIKDESEQLGVQKGWSQEQKDDYIRTKTSDTVYNRVTSLARTKPIAAQKILDQAISEGNIEGDKAGRANSLIRTQKISVTSRVEASNIISGEGGHFGEGKVSTDRLLDAISSNESGGDYNPPHPDVTHKVNGATITEHALGRYGIMQSNLQPWLKDAGMPAMSEQAFLNDHKAQDQLAGFKLSQFQDQYGSANKAANVWFTGSPNPDPSRSDGGTTAARYTQKFNQALARTAGGSEVRDTAERVAGNLSPNDPEFSDALSQRTLAMHRQNLQVQREDDFYNKQTVYNALAPAQDGKLPTSIDEIQDPAAHDAYLKLKPTDRAQVNGILARNAKGDYTETPENQNSYRTWVGKMIDPQRTPEDVEAITNHNFANEPMPWTQRQQLMKMQASIFKGIAVTPSYGQALQILGPMMQNAGIERKNKDDYAQFTGALHMLVEQHIEQTGKKPTPDDIRTMGAGLIREQSYPGTFFGNDWPSTGAVYQLPVPQKFREGLTTAYKLDKGREPTEAEFKASYAVKQFNDFYAAKGKSASSESSTSLGK